MVSEAEIPSMLLLCSRPYLCGPRWLSAISLVLQGWLVLEVDTVLLLVCYWLELGHVTYSPPGNVRTVVFIVDYCRCPSARRRF